LRFCELLLWHKQRMPMIWKRGAVLQFEKAVACDCLASALWLNFPASEHAPAATIGHFAHALAAWPKLLCAARPGALGDGMGKAIRRNFPRQIPVRPGDDGHIPGVGAARPGGSLLALSAKEPAVCGAADFDGQRAGHERGRILARAA